MPIMLAETINNHDFTFAVQAVVMLIPLFDGIEPPGDAASNAITAIGSSGATANMIPSPSNIPSQSLPRALPHPDSQFAL